MMKNKKQHGENVVFLVPLYLFTLVFLIGPFIYMIILSFLTRAETWGVVNEFTVNNYLKILRPVYLNTFYESVKLALLSFWLFYGETAAPKKRPDADAGNGAVLYQLADAPVRMDYCFPCKRYAG